MSKASHKQAVLIMAHHNWSQLQRLVRYFDHKDFDVFLHVDKRAIGFDEECFNTLNKNSNVHIIKRRKINWGTSDQIYCELSLYNTAYNLNDYRYFHLISGDDIPLVRLDDFIEFFKNSNENYIISDIEPQFEIRLQIFHNLLNHFSISSNIKKILNRKLNALQIKLGVNRLKKLKGIFPELRQGHNWCSLTSEAVRLIIQKQDVIRRYFCYTQCADEMYKQTIISNSYLADTISRKEIREIDWSECGSHPKIFTISNYDRLKKAATEGKIFARKFDANVDNDIIEILYSIL